MEVIHVSCCSIERSGQNTAVRIVTTFLVRRSSVRIQAGTREYSFFSKNSRPALQPTKSVQSPLRFFSWISAPGAFCLSLPIRVKGKNKRTYTSALPTGLDDLDRNNRVKCSSSMFCDLQRSSHC